MDYDKIVRLSKIFEKTAQVTVEQNDPVTSVLTQAGFMDASHSSFMDALEEAAEKGIVQEGGTFDISFTIAPKNVILFTFNPANPGLLQIFSKKVGSAMQSKLNQAGINGNGYIKNNWLNWGWV